MVCDTPTRTQQEHVTPGEQDKHDADNSTKTEEADHRRGGDEVHFKSSRWVEGPPPHDEQWGNNAGVADRVPDYCPHRLATRNRGFRVRIPA